MSSRPGLRAVSGGGDDELRPRSSGVQRIAEPVAVAVAALVAGAATLSSLAQGLYAQTAWGAAAMVTLVALAGLLLLRPLELTRPAVAALVGAGGLLVWSACSLAWAAGYDRAWTETNRIGFYVSLLALGLTVLRSQRAVLTAMTTMALGAGIVGVYVLFRMATGSGESLFLDFRLHEPIGYINGQAALFLMGFWALLTFAERGGPPLRRGAALGGAIALADLLLLTQARAVLPALVLSTVTVVALVPGRLVRAWAVTIAVVAAAGAAPFVIEVYASRPPDGPVGLPGDDVLRRAALASLLAGALGGLAWGFAGPALARTGAARRRAAVAVVVAMPLLVASAAVVRIGSPVDEVRQAWRDFSALEVDLSRTQRFTGGGGYRHDLWRIALAQFGDQPLTGVGAGNYAETYLLERRTQEYVRQPHSIELQVLAELGLVGGLLLGLAIISVLLGARARARPGERALEPPLLAGALGICAVWLAHTSVDWIHNLPGLTAMAILAAAALLAHPVLPGTPGRWLSAASPARKAALAAAMLGIALLAASVGRQYAASLYREQGQEVLASDPADALSRARRALELNPHSMEGYYLAASAYARFNRYAQARDALRRAAAEEPFNYVPWALLGDLATRRGDVEQARRDYSRARELNPSERSLALPP